jgi:glucose-fructose oxidoreductase
MNRREFLLASAFAAAGLTSSSVPVFAKQGRRRDKLGVALVGLGYYSTDLLAPALQLTKNCYLAGIVTGSPEKIPQWQEKYSIPDKNVYTYANFDGIANNSAIDVVYVVLPPSLHRDFVVRAANAGKHVFCEKPMAMTVAECEAMIAAAAANKVRLAIGYRCQHDPNIQAYRAIGRNRPFGAPVLLSSVAGFYDPRSNNWRQIKALGGGSVRDMGIYAIQAARMATGEEPMSVLAQSSTTRPAIYKDVDETTQFLLEFPSGARASCMSSFGVEMNYLNVNYEKGWLRMNPHSQYKGNKGDLSDGRLIDFSIANQQARQMDDDCAAIMTQGSLIAPGEEGLRDVRVVEAIYRSAEQQAVVPI